MIDRYLIDYHHTQTYADLVEDEDGDYVLYEDHISEIETLRAENERLREALREVTQTLSWQCFGECRGFSDNLLEPSDAVAIAKEALK